jgi:hypothetical protein
MFARAHPLGVTAAFGVWSEAIDPLLQGMSDAQVTAVCSGLLDDLAGMFHRVAVIRGSLPDREPPLPRLLQGLAALLRNLAGQEVAAQALFELDEDGFLQRLEVAPMDRNTTRELAEMIIGQPPPAALVEWVGQRARGNPLYVISLVRSLLEEHADLSAPACARCPRADRTDGRPHPPGRCDHAGGARPAGRGRAPAASRHQRSANVPCTVRPPGRCLTPGRLAEAALHFARSAKPGDHEAVRVLLDARRATPLGADPPAAQVDLAPLPSPPAAWT